MPEPRTISRATARRFLVHRHFLAPPRSLPAEPESVMTVLGRLGSLQFDPLEVAGRNHDLVLLARIDGYRREWTEDLLYRDRRLFEAYNKGLSLLPTDELPFYRLAWDRSRARHGDMLFVDHASRVQELVGRITREGPLSTIDFGALPPIEWGWGMTNASRALLEALAMSGILGLSERRGNRRYYDLIERLHSAELLDRRVPRAEQRRHKLLSRYRAHGLLGRTGSAELFLGTTPDPVRDGEPGPTRLQLLDELVAGGALLPVRIDGVRGERYAVSSELPMLDAAEASVKEAQGFRDGGVTFLAPLDPFVWDRDFLRQLYGFEYLWEVYTPKAKRTWGYYVLPMLWGDRLVGRIEPIFDRKADTLRILPLLWETGFDPLADPAFADAFASAVEAHRRFGGVRRVTLARVARDREFTRSVRERLAVPGAPPKRPGDARRRSAVGR